MSGNRDIGFPSLLNKNRGQGMLVNGCAFLSIVRNMNIRSLRLSHGRRGGTAVVCSRRQFLRGPIPADAGFFLQSISFPWLRQDVRKFHRKSDEALSGVGVLILSEMAWCKA